MESARQANTRRVRENHAIINQAASQRRGTDAIITYTNAQSIPMRVSTVKLQGFMLDSMLRWTFDLNEWELGFRAAHHDDELERRRAAQRKLTAELYGGGSR